VLPAVDDQTTLLLMLMLVGLVIEKTGAVVHWEILLELHLSSGISWRVQWIRTCGAASGCCQNVPRQFLKCSEHILAESPGSKSFRGFARFLFLRKSGLRGKE
jgi:hypothetical protein